MRNQNVLEKPDISDPHVTGRWWIDDAGRYIRHDCVGPDRAARRRVFRYLGMAEIIAAGNNVTVRWCVAETPASVMISVAHFLATRAPVCRIALEYEWGAWNREAELTPSAALARIAQIGRYRQTRPFTGTKQLPRDLSQVINGRGLLSSAFETWERHKGAFSANHPGGVSRLAEHMLAFRVVHDAQQFAFAHIGRISAAAQVFGATWARTALGRRCDRSQPDFEFDARVCAAYRQVYETGIPLHDHILALIRRAGADDIWVPYRRLVLPMRDRLGAPVVVSVCDVTQDIDIPLMQA